MIVLCIILILLVLLLLTKVGVSLSRENGVFALKLKFGPFSFQILPRRKPEREKKEKTRKKTATAQEKQKKSGRGIDDKLELVQMILRALGGFRKALYVDVFHLRFVAGFDDPYNTAMSCAYAHTVIGILSPLFHAALRVGDSQVEIIPDFQGEKTDLSGKLVLTLRVERILRIAGRFGVEYLRYKHAQKKADAKNTDKSPEPVSASAAG